MHVCHLTSAHPRDDIRIFLKQCRTLAAHYSTSLVVADGLGSKTVQGVRVIDVGRPEGRMARFKLAQRKVFEAAKAVDADVYHLHDPELMPLIGRLRGMGKKVIFDAHEDLPKQIRSKPWIPAVLRLPLAWAVHLYERIVLPKANAVVAATPAIGRKFERWKLATVVVNNYPFKEELAAPESSTHKADPPFVCYVGGMSSIRGIEYMTRALELLPESHAVVKLAGPFTEEPIRSKVTGMNGYRKIEELGVINRAEVAKLMGQSRAGVVTFLPVPNHLEAQPNKMFEYMSASLPVICSDFPLWRELIERYQCGICVDITNPQSLADAIRFVFDNPKLAEEMGGRGRAAVIEHCNWERESAALLELYASFAQKQATHG